MLTMPDAESCKRVRRPDRPVYTPRSRRSDTSSSLQAQSSPRHSDPSNTSELTSLRRSDLAQPISSSSSVTSSVSSTTPRRTSVGADRETGKRKGLHSSGQHMPHRSSVESSKHVRNYDERSPSVHGKCSSHGDERVKVSVAARLGGKISASDNSVVRVSDSTITKPPKDIEKSNISSAEVEVSVYNPEPRKCRKGVFGEEVTEPELEVRSDLPGTCNTPQVSRLSESHSSRGTLSHGCPRVNGGNKWKLDSLEGSQILTDDKDMGLRHSMAEDPGVVVKERSGGKDRTKVPRENNAFVKKDCVNHLQEEVTARKERSSAARENEVPVNIDHMKSSRKCDTAARKEGIGSSRIHDVPIRNNNIIFARENDIVVRKKLMISSRRSDVVVRERRVSEAVGRALPSTRSSTVFNNNVSAAILSRGTPVLREAEDLLSGSSLGQNGQIERGTESVVSHCSTVSANDSTAARSEDLSIAEFDQRQQLYGRLAELQIDTSAPSAVNQQSLCDSPSHDVGGRKPADLNRDSIDSNDREEQKTTDVRGPSSTSRGVLPIRAEVSGFVTSADNLGGNDRVGDLHGDRMVRQLFDPANPDRPVQVTVSSDRRFRPAARCDPTFGQDRDEISTVQGVGSRSSNTERMAQILSRASGELNYIIKTGRIASCWHEISSIRQFVEDECEKLLLSDLSSFARASADQQLWRGFYHGCLDALRSTNKHCSDPHSANDLISKLISNGVCVFGRFLRLLETEYGVPVHTAGTLLYSRHQLKVTGGTSATRSTSLGLAVAQRIVLCLGDLHRYRFISNDGGRADGEQSAFSTAVSYYQLALRLNPKNGRPFNQLAIMALHSQDRLEAVYNFCRALLASNSFQTAHESLLALFHESSKKYMSREHELVSGDIPTVPTTSSAALGVDVSRFARAEVWEHPGHGTRSHIGLIRESTDSLAVKLAAMADSELMKSFTTSFLHVQGKLYTRVNVESFQQDVRVMLGLFGELLTRRSSPVTGHWLLQLLAVAMFSIANTRLKDERVGGGGLHSRYQELALCTALEMAGHVLRRCVDLLQLPETVSAAGGAQLLTSPELRNCISYVKIWCDWLLCSSSIWNPPPSTADFRVGNVEDCWTLLARLTNLLRGLDLDSVVMDSHPGTGRMVVRLPEDITMRCFNPLICMDYDEMFADCKDSDIELFRDAHRVRRILFVTEEFLCGTEPPALCLTRSSSTAADASSSPARLEDCVYVRAVRWTPDSDEGDPESPQPPTSVHPADASPTADNQNDQASDSVLTSSSADRDVTDSLQCDSAANSAQLRRLQREKSELERRVRHQQEHNQRLQAAVCRDEATVLEVTPRYLVADTNCYIDHLDQLSVLVRPHSPFSLVVPVVVLAELDGLSRIGSGFGGSRGARGLLTSLVNVPEGSTGGSEVLLGRAASAALSFIRQSGGESRAAGVRRIRCVSTLGHIVGSTLVTTELLDNDDQLATNDDKIISCCLNMELHTSSSRVENNMRYLRREVVLLTDDRNMRIKALAHDIPTRTVPEFVRWSDSQAK